MEEPYPAVLLPTGASRLDLSNEGFVIDRYVFEFKKSDGTTEIVDLPDLVSPLPKHFAIPLIANRFGCDLEHSSNRRFGKFGFAFDFKRSSVTPESVRIAKNYMREKLGPDSESFRVFIWKLDLEVATGNSTVIEKELLYEIDL